MSLDIKSSDGRDIFQLSAFGTNFIVVSDLDAIEEIITNDPQRFTKQLSILPTFRYTVELFGNGLFFADTDKDAWTIPHSVLKAPFSTKGMKSLLPIMSEQADLLVKCLKREVGYGGICHIDHWVTKMAFETIAVCAAGTSFGSFDDEQDPTFIKAMNNILDGFTPMIRTPPVLWPILFRKQLTQIRADGKTVRDTCIEVVRKRRANETQSLTGNKDIMDMMLHDKDPKSGKVMTEEMIVDNVLTFLFAGQDSTAAAMATMLCYLNANPRCKEQLFKEIDDIVGDSQFEWEHLSQLQYLDWCIRETLRLVPPAGSIARTANGDQTLLNKWRVPDKSLMLVSIMAVHYDKTIWGEDAYEFRPERWANGAPHKYAFIPFASGPRACTGREFTLIEQKITFVKLLRHFDFRRPDNVQAEKGYTTLKHENQTNVPFISMDVEFKTTSAFIGLFSAFELLERRR